MSRRYLVFCVLAALGCARDGTAEPVGATDLAAGAQQTATAQAVSAESHALLVGCTRYPALTSAQQLSGPRNDVLLLNDLLTQRFGFSQNRVVMLCEGRGEEDRPTRSHIQREFVRLATNAAPGSQVVIFMSGHGCQQPSEGNDPTDYEPDGLDEVFCPSDILPATDDEPDRIPNAITDDELRGWLRPILNKNVAVWLIVDACHSGTMSRGVETPREIPPSELVRPGRLEQARQRASDARRGKGLTPHSLEPLDAGDNNLVALYAAQPDEATVEKTLPLDAPDGQCHGLLTYTLNQVLTQSSGSLTYSELTQRIHRRYVQMGRISPTPMLEGAGRNREVLGLREWPGRSQIRLGRDGGGEYSINAGALRDVTPGTVLAVFPAAGLANADKLLGHVVVTKAALLEASVEPCAHGGAPVYADLPNEGRCDVVYADYGLRTLPVALDPRTEAGVIVPEHILRRLNGELKRLEQSQQKLVKIVEDPHRADWLLRVQSLDASPWRVELVPVSGRERANDALAFMPVPADAFLGERLTDQLTRLARATNLLRLAAAPLADAIRGAPPVDVEIQLLRFDDNNDELGTPVDWKDNGIVLNVGDVIALRAHNKGRSPVDVSCLFVDSAFGIDLFFPDPDTAGDNRVLPFASLTTPKATITSATMGLEHMVVIAVKARAAEEPVDFSFLAQSSAEQSRDATAAVNGARRSPLEQLLSNAVNGVTARAGQASRSIDEHAFHVFSWRTTER